MAPVGGWSFRLPDGDSKAMALLTVCSANVTVTLGTIYLNLCVVKIVILKGLFAINNILSIFFA